MNRTGLVALAAVSLLVLVPGSVLSGQVERVREPAGTTIAVTSADLADLPDPQAPPHPSYWHLEAALRSYRAIQARGGWPQVPEGVVLMRHDVQDDERRDQGARRRAAVEDEHRAIVALCERLALTGDLEAPGRDGDACRVENGQAPGYDAALEAAVRRFQSRHGLVVDGIVGPKTIAALNVPVGARIAQLQLNMKRWRRLPDDLGEVHVMVNVAGFQLDVVRHGQPVLTMPVVAGEPASPTPLMSDRISYLEFRPYWNVPDNITRRELLPRIARDPAYLEEKRFEIVEGWDRSAGLLPASSIDWEAAREGFPYRLRQQPGPHNELGLVKFMFPNDYNVYLHDTPATHRFEPPLRAFSHGCVRVADPVGLAAFLLQDRPEWSREAIEAAMNGNERRVVPLGDPVPVHLTYFTAWVGNDVVQFRPDIYGQDREEALRIPPAADTGDASPPPVPAEMTRGSGRR